MNRLLVAGAALAVAISGCPAFAQELTGTLKNIKETGAITLGYRDSSIPFSYLDDNQQPVGYAMEICYKIVDAVKKELKLDKLEVKLNPVTSATRIPLMANGRSRFPSPTPTSSPPAASSRRRPTTSSRSTISRANRWFRPPAPPTSS